MVKCPSCPHYHGGRGDKSCLQCKRYADVQRASVKRRQIPIVPIPQILLEALPAHEGENMTEDAVDYVLSQANALPLRTYIIMAAYYRARATDRDIAEALGISPRQVQRIRAAGVAALKAIIGAGN